MMKIRSILFSFLIVSIILGVSAMLIAYGRGYRVNLKKPTQLHPTGLLSATSDPVGAQVLVDGTLKTATNNSFNLAPGWYTVTVRKEGMIPWEKKLLVQGEVVTRADAYLFPTSPSLSPITTSGVLAPAVSPDGGKIAFLVPAEATRDGVKKAGLYTLELADRPLGGRNRDPKLVAEGAFSSKNSIIWSSDGTEIVVLAGISGTLYDLSTPSRITPISLITLSSLEKDWQKEKATRDRQKLAALPQGFVDVATSSARILAFSPDETKLLYEATRSATIPRLSEAPLIGTNSTEENRTLIPGNLYVYDSREDKNYFIEDSKKIRSDRLPVLPSSIQWFPTNKHVLLTLPGKLDIMEYDRTNWITVYSGPFEDGFVTPWPTGSRIVVLTNLNPGASTLPNLYTVNLR